MRGLLPLLLLALASCSAPEETPADRTGAAAEDPLPVALREAVENLKRAVDAQPTDGTNIADRAQTLADWIDSHALAGRDGAPFASAVRRNVSMPPRGDLLTARSAEIDALVREYQLRDEDPEALGNLAAESLGPFTAGSFDTIRQTWTAGSRGMDAGGGIWLARHFSTLYGPFQADDPRAAGYVTITSSDDDAVFASETIMASGAHGGFRAPQPALIGIFVGDLLLFLAGRLLGAPALERAPLKWFVRPADVERSRIWFRQRGPVLVLLSRFIPGMRLPTYLAAGALRMPLATFALWFLMAAMLSPRKDTCPRETLCSPC